MALIRTHYLRVPHHSCDHTATVRRRVRSIGVGAVPVQPRRTGRAADRQAPPSGKNCPPASITDRYALLTGTHW